jgi:hypothetical protein
MRALAIALTTMSACGNTVARTDAVVDATTATADRDLCNADTCNPILQIGCNPREKCTWVRDEVGAATSGEIGCVPTGTGLLAASCTWGSAGANSGYDDCGRGLVCDAPSDVDRGTGMHRDLRHVSRVRSAERVRKRFRAPRARGHVRKRRMSAHDDRRMRSRTVIGTPHTRREAISTGHSTTMSTDASVVSQAQRPPNPAAPRVEKKLASHVPMRRPRDAGSA